MDILGAVAEIEDGVEEGEIVRVFTSQGDFIAVGMYQIGSIAVRVLSFRDVEIDGEFWFSRLRSAWQMRQAIGLIGRENNNTFRLVHSEGDNLPVSSLTAMATPQSCRHTALVCTSFAMRYARLL